MFKRILKVLIKIHFLLTHKSGEYFYPENKSNKILVSISSGIGDALMASPILLHLNQIYPECIIDVLAHRSAKILFDDNQMVRKTWCLPESKQIWLIFKLIFHLRKQQYDMYFGVIPSNTILQNMIAYLSKVKFKVKHKTPHLGKMNYDFIYDHVEPIPGNKHRRLCNLDLLRSTTIKSIDLEKPFVFKLPDHVIIQSGDLLDNAGYSRHKFMVGFHAGCNKRAINKRWAPSNYVELIDYLQSQYDLQILMVGGQDDLNDTNNIIKSSKSKIFNFTGNQSLLITAALIQKCLFFISNDSGIMHLATAVDVPVFAIFGPTNEKHIGPYGKKHTAIRNGSDVNSVSVELVKQILHKSEYGLKNIINAL